ncbi:hypothetical protein V6N13_074216 [Hibiscus sabdariffa]|uniref:Uncharacterized protein n=1 Tax=Hibiscus sabdariffa TaxID=183260 RepID=A0ABR2U846_9ROSI
MFFALVLSLGFHLPKQKTHGRSSAANLTTLVHEPAVDDISHPNTSKLTPKSKIGSILSHANTSKVKARVQLNLHGIVKLNSPMDYQWVVVSLGSGPWDQLFGGGNSPAFAVAGVAALTGDFKADFNCPL